MSVITAYEVTSDPVPLVVGIAITGISIPVLFKKYLTALAESRVDPPPTAIIVSGEKSITWSNAFFTETISAGGGR